MTHPSDIAGLSEREHSAMTDKIIEGAKEAVAVAKGEIPVASIVANGHRYVPFKETKAALDSLSARVKELEELYLQSQTDLQNALGDRDEAHKQQIRAEQQRDEAYERAAKVAEQQAIEFLSPKYASNQPLGSLCERFACEHVAAAIRRLASGQEGDVKMEGK